MDSTQPHGLGFLAQSLEQKTKPKKKKKAKIERRRNMKLAKNMMNIRTKPET
jgi:hypothetical protein